MVYWGGRVVSLNGSDPVARALVVDLSHFLFPYIRRRLVCLPREPAIRFGMDSYKIDVVDNGAIVKVFLLEGAFPWNTPKRILESAGGFWESYGKMSNCMHNTAVVHPTLYLYVFSYCLRCCGVLLLPAAISFHAWCLICCCKQPPTDDLFPSLSHSGGAPIECKQTFTAVLSL